MLEDVSAFLSVVHDRTVLKSGWVCYSSPDVSYLINVLDSGQFRFRE